MITRTECLRAQRRAAEMIRQAGVRITSQEAAAIEVVDFGLSHLAEEGVQVLTLFATDRVSAKILVTFPGQTEPEHWHPPVGADPGKEETIRVISGALHVYVPGADTFRRGWIPRGKDAFYTCRHELILPPCGQWTFPPGTPHWFQAPEPGAVFYSISTCVRDALDGFADPGVVRLTRIVEDGEEPMGSHLNI
ncbi:MAG TPA: D-lyxose/D-mannose family sugar isomerase [Candidatus Paceibacterota bacterium]|nr:D-lyxose/D-mannose family sugar isomerase [Verrucomicrobiota bacterium]HRZ44118.1 D-lyxose/D-mannose family sugar isomerase [Candidatus Paceibacterota bacterium]HRZ94668.1 D-lyxose/D-mannose family sugar isomerase [Candidatus Paceibacterota bacterium]